MRQKRKVISVTETTYNRLDKYRNSFYGQNSFDSIINQMLEQLDHD